VNNFNSVVDLLR